MLRRTKHSIVAGAAGVILLGLVLGFGLPAGAALSLTPVKGGRPLAVIWLARGETFTIRYNHSVEEAPIWETHSVDSRGNIFIEEERYLKFGAGMGKMPGVGHMVRRGPYEVIENMHMPTGDFVLRIGSPSVDHTVLWPHGEIRLSARAPHVAVRFSAEPVGWINLAWHRWRASQTKS